MPPLVTFRLRPAEAGTPLLDYLAGRLGISRKQAKRLLDSRAVFVNRRRVWMARHPLEAGDVVEAPGRPAAAPRPDRLRILWQDDEALAVDKPAGLLSTGTDSAEERLTRQLGQPVLAVHRIDRDTSGCLLLARNPAVRDRFVALFEARSIHKTYRALAMGAIPWRTETVRAAVDGQEAVTHFRVLSAGRRASYVEARPETGRTHQVRLHLRALGHPLLGDRVYVTREIDDEGLRAVPRQMLHAWRLAWKDAAGARRAVEAPLPADFRDWLRELKLA